VDISIIPYNDSFREGCMAAFLSNVPKFFTQDEIRQFNEWLDYLENMEAENPSPRISYYYVMLQEGKVIGCGGFGYNTDPDRAVLAWGLVHQAYHKKQIGRLLLEFRLKKLAEVFPSSPLWLDTTQHSYPFFQKFGFVIRKFTENGYAPGMHRYDMEWQPPSVISH